MMLVCIWFGLYLLGIIFANLSSIIMFKAQSSKLKAESSKFSSRMNENEKKMQPDQTSSSVRFSKVSPLHQRS
jgi:hypothetical protein